MDLRQIDNIIAIEQEKSISKAAQKLFLTQSALNQQLLRLEKELGTQLFERKSHSMVPTVAGRIYLNTARQMVDLKQETYKIIHDISGERRGEISLAYSPEQGSLMFSNVYPIFHAAYPEITFRIAEARVKKMEQLLLQKEVTLACLAYFGNHKNPAIEYNEMEEEFIVLGLPISHPLASLAGERSYDTLPSIDLTLFKGDSFALIARDSRMRDLVDELFERAGFIPNILFESASTQTVFNMVKQQICPAFFPQSYVDPDAPIAYFTVPPRHTWMRTIAYLKGSYLTKPEKYFMSLAINYVKGTLEI
ncbi:DNA-binding transcriptional LysR family regulator [Lacrimispora xylanisolvens]|uniref:DNA-binding transcriptional LysR family regulator n=1 Tax=Lacrimispora xylanisolvens TaxID=384636 RepID=A0A2S6HUK5_9FIRM|nr:LysR family transcriptional regulator [Hungatella xylanolytica]PPK81508.1 DNA-binding transcriptional LysR family regulator [Hungatella xylanolytica]